MSDLPPKIPDIIKPPVVEQKSDSLYPFLDKNNTYVSAILSSNIDEINKLSEEIKFLEQLKKLPDYKGSKVQEAIEKGTIEIKRIPGRNGYAIYESKVGNLVYIVRLNGTGYENVDKYRNKDILGDSIKGGFIRQGYKKIEFDKNTGLRKLYKNSGEEIFIFSDEYRIATLNSINYMRNNIRFFFNSHFKRNKPDKDDIEILKKLELDI